MEFPFGHGHHHHHHHPDTNEAYPPPPGQHPYPPPAHQPYPPPAHDPYPPPPAHQPYPPPPAHQPYAYPPDSSLGPYGAPPPPVVHHVSHEEGGGFFGRHHHHHQQSRPQDYGGTHVQHVGHEDRGGGFFGHGHGHGHFHQQQPRPQEHVGHEVGPERGQRTVRIYTKAEESYSLSIRDGKVVLAKADHTDPYQHWIRDLKYSTKVKDEEGFPSFALINKATGEALKHSIGATHPVRLIPYNPDYLDESVLWTESKDLGDGFRCIRMVNNIRLNFDAFHGDENHGGVHDGTILVLWEWLKGKNQRWKIVAY